MSIYINSLNDVNLLTNIYMYIYMSNVCVCVCMYIYIYIYTHTSSLVLFYLVWFYGISTIAAMPNPVYTYILNIYKFCQQFLSVTYLNEPERICFHSLKWFQVLLHNNHNLMSIIVLHL